MSTAPPVHLVRSAAHARTGHPAPVLDIAQRQVVEHRGGPLRVLAGPGTGKSTTLVEAVVDRVQSDGLDAGNVLILTYGRHAAAQLRARVSHRLGRTTREPVARTFHSYAFGLLRREATTHGEPAPRLLSGAEQDLIIRELLRGELEDGARGWPSSLRPALPTHGFAEEVRDALLRMVERGVSPAELDAWGRARGRADWTALARFAELYAGVTALRQQPSFDPAELVRAAVDLLQTDRELLARERSTRAFVVVDEYQDSDPAQEALLQLIAGGGQELVVVGDPDQAIYGFRGSDPVNIERFCERFTTADGSPAHSIALQVSRRAGEQLTTASRRVASRLGGASAHRALRPAPQDRTTAVDGIGSPGGPGAASDSAALGVHVFGAASQEATFIATRLRTAHLIEGVPWSEMAVVVRSASAVPALHRALSAAEVPVNVQRADIPLYEQPAARALIDLLELATGGRDADADLLTGVLSGPLFNLDALALRRLRQVLRNRELREGGGRSSTTIMVSALTDPTELIGADDVATAPLRRLLTVLEAGRSAAGGAGAGAEDVLWALWSALGLAEPWSDRALRGGALGALADHHLDAVVELFDAASRFADRLPGAGPAAFGAYIRAQQLPTETVSVAMPAGGAVRVLTAHSAKGLEWDLVVVAGVQEGVWPDVRLRGTLLGLDEIVEQAAGLEGSASQRQSARLAEERRLFYVAVTRARRQLLVTAVAHEDSQPSRFLSELDPLASEDADRGRAPSPRSMDLASLVAALRYVVCDSAADPARRAGAARGLARLVADGVPHADPGEWYGAAGLSDAGALADPEQSIAVSPSKVEEFEQCGLRWLLRSAGAENGSQSTAVVGTLVHDIAEAAHRHEWDEAMMLAELDRRWPTVDAGHGWIARRTRSRAEAMVTLFAQWQRANPRTVLAVESEFSVEIGRAILTGRVDRLEQDEHGRLVVVDLKTGTKTPAGNEVPQHPQLLTYQLAVLAGGFAEVSDSRTSGGASLLHVGRTGRTGAAKEQTQGPLDEEAYAAAEQRVDGVAEGMAAASFAAVPGPWCRSCPVRTSCPAVPEGGVVTS